MENFKEIGRIICILCLVTTNLAGQELLVDQASGDLNEIVTTTSRIPPGQIAQSFTPSLSAVGFVQLTTVVNLFPGNDQVTLAVNLRAGSYNGPILSSTDPVVLVNHTTEIGTFYYPQNVAVTPSQLYFFEPVVLAGGSVDIGYKFPSTYPGGEAWNNGVPSATGADYWFREGVVVPEPSAACLLLAGLVLIPILRRSRV